MLQIQQALPEHLKQLGRRKAFDERNIGAGSDGGLLLYSILGQNYTVSLGTIRLDIFQQARDFFEIHQDQARLRRHRHE